MNYTTIENFKTVLSLPDPSLNSPEIYEFY